MITYINKDITTVTSGLVIHGVNCRGAFASGVAGAIRKAWPSVYKKYADGNFGWQMLGRFDPVKLSEELYVANCYTQLDYGNIVGQRYADPQAIRKCLVAAFDYCQLYDLVLKSPKIGCGLGGLSWENDVKNIFEQLNTEYNNIDVEIFEI